MFTRIVVLLQCEVAKSYHGVRKTEVVVEAVTTVLMREETPEVATVMSEATAEVEAETEVIVIAAEVEGDEGMMEVVQCSTKLTIVERS